MTSFDIRTSRRSSIAAVLTTVLATSLMTSASYGVKVAVVRSWGNATGLSAMKELNDHWPNYGEIRVEIDHSLHDVASFTYQDLVDTGADVIWLSNPAGHPRLYSQLEIDAIKQYAEEGHHVLATYRVFRFLSTDNRKLAPILGLPEQIYNQGPYVSEQTFELLQADHPIFRDVPSPFTTQGFGQAQVPVDDLVWNANDLGNVQLLARADDEGGVITLFQAEKYHGIYISKFFEFVNPPQGKADTQLLYNVLTFDAPPTGACCLADGGCVVAEESGCDSANWTKGGRCVPNRCPQLGACCLLGTECEIAFQVDCPDGRWTEQTSCTSDRDEDAVVDGCDRCPGSPDSVDVDFDGVPDGCDRCPGADDAQDQDADTVPDACDACADSDDRQDRDQDGIPDGCDRCEGSDDAKDCDQDETPDGCDEEPDCNENGSPDHCEIRDGAADCDENGVPDACQPDTDGDGIIDPCDGCIGDNALLEKSCDSAVDADDCRTGVFDCTGGTLHCTDDDELDDADSDADGVFDCNDLCPGTPPNVEVLSDGCRPTGACCFAQNICFPEVVGEDCALIGGAFLGHGLTCTGDSDQDFVAGCADGCPLDGTKSAPGQCGCGQPDTDNDADDVANCVDGCPDDGQKTSPGICGCGSPDQDSDGDLVLDCQDGCPQDVTKTEPGICGCNRPDVDGDSDGVVDCQDGCPLDGQKTEPGVCGCGHPDVDTDGDHALDCQDGCPKDAEKLTPGVCGCGIPDVDSDGDEKLDCEDGCPADPLKIVPGACGCGAADEDLDDDAVVDCNDDCPGTPADEEVDEDGCPFFGACCFRIGVCVNRAAQSPCDTIGGFYQGNGTTCGEPCSFPPVDGDRNGDGKVNLADFADWGDCMEGPNVESTSPDCEVFDLTHDDDVDIVDFGRFQQLFGGE